MKIVFIGCGGIARAHADGLVKREGVAFVGAFDALPERARSFAGQYGGTAYSSVVEMLDDAKPDAAWVCLPPHAHGEAEQALMARRIPFLVEKPISNSLDTARRILEQVERAGVPVAAGYMNRYRRSVNRVKELLAGDPPMLVHGGWVGGTPMVPWWRVKAQSGGQIVEQTTHIFDVVRYVVGEPRVVYAQGARGFVADIPGYDVEDASAVAVQFEGGAVGSLMSCCASTAGGGVHLSIAARKHYVSLTGWDMAAVIRKSSLEEEHIAGETDIFAIEDGAFIDAVQKGDAGLLRSPYADAVRTLAFCLAANRSLETGAPVEVASL